MLYFILVWGLLTCVSFTIGLGLLNAFQAKGFKRSTDRFFAAIWLGIVTLANGLLAISLITPLSPLIGLLTAGSLMVLSLGFPQVRSEVRSILLKVSDRWLFIVTGLAIVAAALMSKQVTWFDTGLYHFGSIRWMADYGVVPGIALINNGFAFISSWFALAAPFNPDFLGSRVSAVLNGYLLFLTLLQASTSLYFISRQTAQRSDWLIVIYAVLILPLFIFTPFLSAVLISPSPDMPVIMLTGMVAWALLVISEKQTPETGLPLQTSTARLNSQIVPLILGAGAVTFKLNALPILGITGLFYGFSHRRHPKPLGVGIGMAGILLMPTITFSSLASGCPLYPSSLLCMDVPWALSSDQAAQALSRINGWQDWFGSPPPGVNTWLWTFSKWWQLAHLNKIMLLLAALSVIFAIWILTRVNFKQHAGEPWIIALSLLGMGFIFWQAPLIRFGLGYFVLLPTLIGIHLCYRNNLLYATQQKLSELFSSLPKGSLLLFLFIASIVLVRTHKLNIHQQLFIPPELPQSTLESKQVNDIHYFSPSNSNKCWGADLPCAPKELGQDIWLRNPSQGVAGGFEKKELGNESPSVSP